MAQTYLSIIIPAYNEEKRLAQTLRKVLEYLKNKDFSSEVIIVDDGSTDKTKWVCEDFPEVQLISYEKNQGKGFAVKKAMLRAKGELCLFADADNSTPIEELEKFQSLTEEYEIIIGSRALKESEIKIHQPMYREILGKIFNKIVRLLTVRGIHDTQCGFKLFNRKAVNIIFPKQTINRFAFDVELLFIAQKNKLKIKEMPVVWINDKETKVRLTNTFEMFKEILKIKINDWKGKYN